ncbi:hypothetical protein AciX8_0405 [Granulicella mallensis MP5ACTX8]|uniref:Uncharacterized protein n=1 Tax=Granulicella mallensis (strain ATCC BAA-1857 / DSM 23137 / MP5ACTX8) TaxID=682795 RepID=G8NNH5_GRAMM|nr:hypothetical protein AciX8_0405 [Granulicella mallensis MP5ACTX8]
MPPQAVCTHEEVPGTSKQQIPCRNDNKKNNNTKNNGKEKQQQNEKAEPLWDSAFSQVPLHYSCGEKYPFFARTP